MGKSIRSKIEYVPGPITIKHRMKDGTIRDSIEGVEVPKGHPIYAYLAELAEKYHDVLEERSKLSNQ